LPGLTIENVLATGITLEDFHRFLDRHYVVWTAPSVYVRSGIWMRNVVGEIVLSLRVCPCNSTFEWG
jgi:hypothetical protein